MEPGDLIKLGRIEYRVIECKYDNFMVKTIEEVSEKVIIIL